MVKAGKKSKESLTIYSTVLRILKDHPFSVALPVFILLVIAMTSPEYALIVLGVLAFSFLAIFF